MFEGYCLFCKTDGCIESPVLSCPVLWYEEVSGTSTHISTRHTSTLTNHRQCWTIIYYGAQYFAVRYTIVRHITIKECPVIYTTQLYDSLLYIAVNCTLLSSTVLVRSKKTSTFSIILRFHRAPQFLNPLCRFFTGYISVLWNHPISMSSTGYASPD